MLGFRFISPYSLFSTMLLTFSGILTVLGQNQELDDSWQQELDHFFKEEGPRFDIFGLGFAMVRDGEIVHLEGLGKADRENQMPVDPEETMFYLASTGKIFPVLAALRLKAEGKLHMDVDINDYLTSLQIPQREGQSITMHHLLTHSDGLEDRLIGYAVPDPEELLPLSAYLATHLPKPLRPPGQIIGYSNHGFGLAGQVAADLRGMDYKQLLEGELLPLLGMGNARVIPFNEQTLGKLAKAYRWSGEQVPFGYSQVPPAGGVAATTADMAMLMRVLLPGENQTPILDASFAMTRQISHDPRLPGRGYGFWQYDRGGIDGWLIAGTGYGFASLLYFSPERRIGFFAVSNRQEPLFLLRLLERFQEHYWPAASKKEVTMPEMAGVNLQQLGGQYRWVRYNASTLEKLFYLFITMTVRVDDDGKTLVTELQGARKLWRPVDTDLLQELDSGQLMATRYDSESGIVYLFNNATLTMPMAFEKLAWHERPAMLGPLFALLCFALATMACLPMFVWLGRRVLQMSLAWYSGNRGAKLSLVQAWLHLIFIMGLGAHLASPAKLFFGIPFLLKILLWLPLLSLALLVSQMFMQFFGRRGGDSEKVSLWRWFAWLIFACFLGLYAKFNLLGFPF